MKREDEDLKALFARMDRQITINPKQKEETLAKLAEMMDQKRAPRTVSWFSILKSQLYYMERGAWILGLLMNLGFAGLMPVLNYLGADMDDLIACSMMASSILGTCSIWILSALFTDGTTELADTCYFHVKQLAALEMLVLGTVNLITLAGAACYAGIRWKMWVIRAGLYMGVPFLFTVSICLGCLMTERGRRKRYPLAAAGIASVVLTWFLTLLPGLYLLSAAAVWCAGLAAGLTVLFLQVGRLFLAIEKGELLCTD